MVSEKVDRSRQIEGAHRPEPGGSISVEGYCGRH
jgi:hypothetical protein